MDPVLETLLIRIGLPGLMLLAGCFVIGWAVRGWQARRCWPGTIGTVQGYALEEDGGGEGSAYRAVVHVTYDLDGRTIEAKGPLGSADWAILLAFAKRDLAKAERESPVGSRMEIIFDPRNPQLVMPVSRRALEIRTVAFGLLFVAVGVLLLPPGIRVLIQALSGG